MTRQCLTKLNPKEYLPVWSMQMPGSVRTGTTAGRVKQLVDGQQTFCITTVM